MTMKSQNKKRKKPKRNKAVILFNRQRIIKSYWLFSPLVLLIYIILSFLLDLSLNAISYRIISTFCSIIIGFGINSYFNLMKLDTNVVQWKHLQKRQTFMLKLIKVCVSIAFVLLFLSILAVSSSKLFPKIFDYLIILAIGFIFNLVYLLKMRFFFLEEHV